MKNISERLLFIIIVFMLLSYVARSQATLLFKHGFEGGTTISNGGAGGNYDALIGTDPNTGFTFSATVPQIANSYQTGIHDIREGGAVVRQQISNVIGPEGSLTNVLDLGITLDGGVSQQPIQINGLGYDGVGSYDANDTGISTVTGGIYVKVDRYIPSESLDFTSEWNAWYILWEYKTFAFDLAAGANNGGMRHIAGLTRSGGTLSSYHRVDQNYTSATNERLAVFSQSNPSVVPILDAWNVVEFFIDWGTDGTDGTSWTKLNGEYIAICDPCQMTINDDPVAYLFVTQVYGNKDDTTENGGVTSQRGEVAAYFDNLEIWTGGVPSDEEPPDPIPNTTVGDLGKKKLISY